MLQEGDPFQQTASDLELLLQKSKSIQHKVSTSGFVSSNSFEEIGEIYNESVDLLGVLKEALQVLNDTGGKINGKVFSANEIVQRQNTVRGFENDVDNLKKFYTSLSARQEAVSASMPSQEETSDNYVLLQQRAQQEEIAQQEEVMERMAHGLQELRETGLNINNELETQNTILVDVDRNISTVQARLRSANEKLDQLLASLSNKGKICTICALLGIIFVLFILL